MGVRIGCGLSREQDPATGAAAAARCAAGALGGAAADLVFVFASGAHLAAPEATLDAVHDVLAPGALAGCGAGGVLAGGVEVEHGTGVAVWAASFEDGSAEVTALAHAPAEVSGASALMIIADPYSFPADTALHALAAGAPGVPIIGGLSSARTLDGGGALLCGEEVVESGAVVVRLDGVEVLPCVSQGAAAIGPSLTITACDGHVIHELDGEPALPALRDVVATLSEADRARVVAGLLLGIAVEGGDHLVRGVLGADPDTGSVAIGARVAEGQAVRLHARDAGTADRDLREALGLRRLALGGREPAGALVFTCNGRGRDMFGVDHHDAGALADELGPVPAAGFFAAGEIGPVAGQPFLHGFTATIGVFAP